MTALSDVLSISHFVNWLKWLIKTVLVLFWFLILLQGRPFFLSISLKELEVCSDLGLHNIFFGLPKQDCIPSHHWHME
jgi:hypothetical protein